MIDVFFAGALDFVRDSKGVKSEIAMSKSNFNGWPTRAVLKGERRRIPFPALAKAAIC